MLRACLSVPKTRTLPLPPSVRQEGFLEQAGEWANGCGACWLHRHENRCLNVNHAAPHQQHSQGDFIIAPYRFLCIPLLGLGWHPKQQACPLEFLGATFWSPLCHFFVCSEGDSLCPPPPRPRSRATKSSTMLRLPPVQKSTALDVIRGCDARYLFNTHRKSRHPNC